MYFHYFVIDVYYFIVIIIKYNKFEIILTSDKI